LRSRSERTSMRPSNSIPDAIALVVVGAHLKGMPLNHELEGLDAVFLRESRTRPVYRLYALADRAPAKPGLLRVGEGEGSAIDVEVWSLAPAAFGAFVSRIPAPLGIGTIELADGDPEKGFLVEAVATRNARDISGFGGWRNFQRSVKPLA
jgi:allophanate hydrolase